MTRWLWIGLAGCADASITTEDALDAMRAPPAGSERFRAYQGHMPCEDCNRLKTALTLHHSASDGAPTTFVFERIGVGDGNDRLVDEGSWTLEQTCDAEVFVLDGAPPFFSTWLALGDADVLVLLDEDRRPRVGTASESYALSRTD